MSILSDFGEPFCNLSTFFAVALPVPNPLLIDIGHKACRAIGYFAKLVENN
ncbi:MAG: hypothetical protein AB1589_27455 [Cyanobacteriota bacterium]